MIKIHHSIKHVEKEGAYIEIHMYEKEDVHLEREGFYVEINTFDKEGVNIETFIVFVKYKCFFYH